LFLQVGSKYTVKLPENPCSFSTYDADSDGKISEGELFGVLGIDMIPASVLKDLDVVTGLNIFDCFR
jgi:Ca2+-binding EF-hand superfamily protein